LAEFFSLVLDGLDNIKVFLFNKFDPVGFNGKSNNDVDFVNLVAVSVKLGESINFFELKEVQNTFNDQKIKVSEINCELLS